jgi:hypothetical protein
MPSCNLTEIVHNKWLQQSGNRGNDLYVATVDDFVRALMQVSRYYQYLKVEIAGTGSGKEELMLRVAQRSAQRSGNPKVLNVAIAKMPRAAELCTREPHFEGEEVFGSQKRKADISLGSKHKSHRLDKINFSHPRIQTRSSTAKEANCSLNIIPEELSPDLQDGQTIAPDTPIKLVPPIDISRTTHATIQETRCNEYQWHIARLPKTSAKACFAQQVVTKKKCIAKIVQDNKSTAAPTYISMMINCQKKTEELMQFFFCNDDIEWCVKGLRRRWVKSRPDVPDIWPMKLGTNLTKKEISALENTGFHLPQRAIIFPKRLFGGDILVDVASYPIPPFPDNHPKARSGKNIRRNKKTPTTKHTNNCASALTLKTHVRQS